MTPESTLREAMEALLRIDDAVGLMAEGFLSEELLIAMDVIRRALSPTANAEMVMVPREPTAQMRVCGIDAYENGLPPTKGDRVSMIYKAMLSAAMLSATPDSQERRKAERRQVNLGFSDGGENPSCNYRNSGRRKESQERRKAERRTLKLDIDGEMKSQGRKYRSGTDRRK